MINLGHGIVIHSSKLTRRDLMGRMVCGAETTEEEEFIYNPDVSALLDDVEQRIVEETHEDPPRIRSVLEAFAWTLRQKIDEEGW